MSRLLPSPLEHQQQLKEKRRRCLLVDTRQTPLFKKIKNKQSPKNTQGKKEKSITKLYPYISQRIRLSLFSLTILSFFFLLSASLLPFEIFFCFLPLPQVESSRKREKSTSRFVRRWNPAMPRTYTPNAKKKKKKTGKKQSEKKK